MRRQFFFCFSIAIFVLSGSIGHAQSKPAGLLDYHDYWEMRSALVELSASQNARGEMVGSSFDYTEGGSDGYAILALRISAHGSTAPRVNDNGDARPSILFDAGIHPREWLTSECLIELAKYLVEQAKDPKSRISRALRSVDVWIIPMSNPAGRIVDDPSSGDPRQYFTSQAQQTSPGWRGNADTRVGLYGVDVGRNFSRDWINAKSDPDGSHWRGIAPFSSTEASALRQFVQNHWIGMAVHLHTTSQDVWNLWGKEDLAGSMMRHRAAAIWMERCERVASQLGRPVGELKLELDERQLGTSSGQFSAWLANSSDTPEQPDQGTVRAIQTLLFELPFDNANLRNYYNTLWQFAPQDGSNSFHPSAEAVQLLIHKAFIPMAEYLIEQAAAPCCVTKTNDRGNSTPEANGYQPGDVGILAAKIGVDPGAPGTLRSYPATQSRINGRDTVTAAQDYLHSGRAAVYYWIQNYGKAASPCIVRIHVQSRKQGAAGPWKTVESVTRPAGSLAPLEKRFDQVPIRIGANSEYQVTVTVAGPRDQFTQNNRKVFRFVGVSELPEFRHDRISRE